MGGLSKSPDRVPPTRSGADLAGCGRRSHRRARTLYEKQSRENQKITRKARNSWRMVFRLKAPPRTLDFFYTRSRLQPSARRRRPGPPPILFAFGNSLRLNLLEANSKNWLNSSNYNYIRSLFHLVKVRQSTAKFVQIRSVWGKFGETSLGLKGFIHLVHCRSEMRKLPQRFLPSRSGHSLSKSPGRLEGWYSLHA